MISRLPFHEHHREYVCSAACANLHVLMHLFSWLFAIGLFLLVAQILDLGSPCSQEDTTHRFPSYQPISE